MNDDQRVAGLCVRLGQGTGPLATPGPMRDLAARIASRLRGAQVAGDMDADLDQLEDLLLKAGFTGGLGAPRSPFTPLGGVGGGHPVLEVLACPVEACRRMEAPPTSGGDPVCGVLDRPMRRVRLRS